MHPGLYRLLLLLAIGSTDDLSAATMQIARTDLADYPAVRVYVDVRSGDQAPVSGLASEDFSVVVDGTDVDSLRSQSFDETSERVSIVLVLDASGTMKGKPLEEAKKAVLTFVSDLRPADRLAVLTFHDQVQIVSEFSGDRERLKRNIRGIQASGTRTEMYKGVLIGLRLYENTDLPERRIMVVLSDGKDEGREPATYTFDRCVLASRENDTPIHTVGLSRLVKDRAHYQDVLRGLASESGGTYSYAESPEDLRDSYTAILKHLSKQYVLSFQGRPKTTHREIDLSVTAGTDEGTVVGRTRVRVPIHAVQLPI